MSEIDERLDRLLSAPLPPVADDGFSGRVIAKIAATNIRQPWLETAVLVATACVVVAALSEAGFSEWLERAGFSLATSLPLAIAGFALALTLSCARVLAD